MDSFAFWAPGVPQTKGSARHVGRGRIVNDNPKTKGWQEAIGWALREAGWHGTLEERGGFEVRARFVLPRPAGHSNRHGNLKLNQPTLPGVKPDGDKLLRAVFDALTGIVYADDAQVVDWAGSKRYAEEGCSPGAEITFQRVAGRAKS